MDFGVTLILKGGGFETVKINAVMLGELAESIKREGSYAVATKTEVMEVVGVLVVSKEASPGVIMLGTDGLDS